MSDPDPVFFLKFKSCLSHEKDYRQMVVLFEFTILMLCILYATDFETSKHLLDIHSSFHTNQEILICTHSGPYCKMAVDNDVICASFESHEKVIEKSPEKVKPPK